MLLGWLAGGFGTTEARQRPRQEPRRVEAHDDALEAALRALLRGALRNRGAAAARRQEALSSSKVTAEVPAAMKVIATERRWLYLDEMQAELKAQIGWAPSMSTMARPLRFKLCMTLKVLRPLPPPLLPSQLPPQWSEASFRFLLRSK